MKKVSRRTPQRLGQVGFLRLAQLLRDDKATIERRGMTLQELAAYATKKINRNVVPDTLATCLKELGKSGPTVQERNGLKVSSRGIPKIESIHAQLSAAKYCIRIIIARLNRFAEDGNPAIFRGVEKSVGEILTGRWNDEVRDLTKLEGADLPSVDHLDKVQAFVDKVGGFENANQALELLDSLS